MSEGNVEIVRQIYKAANRGDFEQARELLHPEAEMHQPAEFPDAKSYYGREEFERGVAIWTAEWAQMRFDVGAIRELADGRVLMEITLRGRGKRSGAEMEQGGLFHLWTVQDGKGRRCDVYIGLEKALEAAGLSE
jgi:ketosteroid isomerase-like protein